MAWRRTVAAEWHRVQPAFTAVGAIVAVVVIARYLADVNAVGPNQRPLGDLLEHRIWSALGATSLVVWTLIVWRTVHIAAGWNRREVPRWLHVLRSLVPAVLYLVVVWTLIVVPRDLLRMNLDPPVPDEVARRAALLAVAAVLAAGSPVVGMWQVYARIRDLATALNGAGRVWTPARFLEELRDTWMDAQRCLGGLSLLVALGTVVTGAFRNTVMAAGYPEKQFPGSTVLLYGAFFTVLGLLVYVPLYMAWKSRVTAFLDQLYPAPEDGKPDEEWSAGRARAQAFVGADGTLAKNLTSAAGILAPLASSVLTVFVPKIG